MRSNQQVLKEVARMAINRYEIAVPTPDGKSYMPMDVYEIREDDLLALIQQETLTALEELKEELSRLSINVPPAHWSAEKALEFTTNEIQSQQLEKVENRINQIKEGK